MWPRVFYALQGLHVVAGLLCGPIGALWCCWSMCNTVPVASCLGGWSPSFGAGGFAAPSACPGVLGLVFRAHWRPIVGPYVLPWAPDPLVYPTTPGAQVLKKPSMEDTGLIFAQDNLVADMADFALAIVAQRLERTLWQLRGWPSRLVCALRGGETARLLLAVFRHDYERSKDFSRTLLGMLASRRSRAGACST